ncbi:hypothetical protein U1Q18_036038 [Sarracenia purpurea var. burkii]
MGICVEWVSRRYGIKGGGLQLARISARRVGLLGFEQGGGLLGFWRGRKGTATVLVRKERGARVSARRKGFCYSYDKEGGRGISGMIGTKEETEDDGSSFVGERSSSQHGRRLWLLQKASISELKAQLDEERDQRRDEREKAAVDLKTSIQRVQAEAQEELKRLSDCVLRREREQQEVINKLQEESRNKLVLSDNKVRQLEGQICEEQLVSANRRNMVEELEHEAKTLRKELESEKAAREEAWAKVSALELEINDAMRDLDFERRRLKGARERIMLRETQLRAFYSTTEEISALFAKQQDQLKAMQRTLEDEENYENTSFDVDLNLNSSSGNVNGALARTKDALGNRRNVAVEFGSGPSSVLRRHSKNQAETSSDDEASVTEKHDCDIRSQEDGQNTQEAEFTSAEQFVKGGFGSDIDGVGTALVQEGDPIGTEQVLETESLGIDCDRNNIDVNKCSEFAGDTMQLDDEAREQEAVEGLQMISGEILRQSQSNNNNPLEIRNTMEEDTEVGDTIRTVDLLASEVAGSWACSTAPSVHGENESPKSRDNDEECNAASHDSNARGAQSQSTSPSFSEALAAKPKKEHQALCEMIGIIAPDLKEQFAGAVDNVRVQEEVKKGFVSNSDTEDCTDNDDDVGDDNDDVGVNSESESRADVKTDASDQVHEKVRSDAVDEDDEATQEDEDSVG